MLTAEDFDKLGFTIEQRLQWRIKVAEWEQMSEADLRKELGTTWLQLKLQENRTRNIAKNAILNGGFQ